MSSKFYITTPIYYVNAKPHLGHTYTTIAADVLARYHRMIGDRTFFATGTDEHGAKIEAKAREAGQEPQVFADGIAASFQLAWDELAITNDRFIRTTEKEHIRAVQKALQQMYEQGDIYLDTYEGLYCQGCEQFKSRRDLVDGKCQEHMVEPEVLKEESYMFRMSKYSDVLLRKIENDELKISPDFRKNEVVRFYRDHGLEDVSFSRQNVKWGIPLPWDESHTAYVWSDAFLNYLTVLGWQGEAGQAPEMFPPDIQLMSKDILRVHATIWPAMLLSLGLPLPREIFVHGFFLVEGRKMSKSLGNVIGPAGLKDNFGVDGTRYLLLRATTFGQDGDISWQWFSDEYNASLANGLGNLVGRSVALVEKLRKAGLELEKADLLAEKDGALPVGQAWQYYTQRFEDKQLNAVVKDSIGSEIRQLDSFITEHKPWVMIKEGDARAGAVLYTVLERLRHLAWMSWPIMPETAEELWRRIGLEPEKEMQKGLQQAQEWGGLATGTEIQKGAPLFPKLENK